MIEMIVAGVYFLIAGFGFGLLAAHKKLNLPNDVPVIFIMAILWPVTISALIGAGIMIKAQGGPK